MTKKTGELCALLEKAKTIEGVQQIARFYHDEVFAKMNEIRADVDELETMVASDYWPVPNYGEILFSVK
jgi:glutamine synthetase